MKNNKAFTLTEIIAVLAIIGVILTISIPAASNLMTNNKHKEYMLYVETVEKAVLAYADMECGTENPQTITIGDLEEKGYLKEQNGKISPSITISFNKDSNGKVAFNPNTLELSFLDGTVCTKISCYR